MRRPAASMPVMFRSRPSTARDSTDFSASSDVWKDCEDSRSCVARDSRESVKLSCSWACASRADSVACVLEREGEEVVGRADPVAVAVAASAVSDKVGWRL